MRFNELKKIMLAVSLAVINLAATAQGFAPFSGHVADNTQHNVPNLQVRLRPPQNTALAGQIALTDQSGNFNFPRVQGGRYLLEISQGPFLLYRQTVTLPAAAMTITVQRH